MGEIYWEMGDGGGDYDRVIGWWGGDWGGGGVYMGEDVIGRVWKGDLMNGKEREIGGKYNLEG